MGGFYLYPSNSAPEQPAVTEVFRKMALDSSSRYRLGAYSILLFDKAFVSTKHVYHDEEGNAIFITGSLIYHSLFGKDCLQKLLKDFKDNQIDHGKLQGAFCVIFYVNNQIYLLPDVLGVYRVWYDSEHQHLSSSFLATIAGRTGLVEIDKQAVLLNLVCGFPPADQSMVRGIKRLSASCQLPTKIQFIKEKPAFDTLETKIDTLQWHSKAQLEVLNKTLSQLNPLLSDSGVEVGISGGYDSRLLLAALKEFPLAIQAHTFDKVGDDDPRIAQQVADTLQVPLRKIKRTYLTEMTAVQQQAQLEDSLHFFDGQISNMMHLFGNEYSIAYRKTLSDANHQVILSGVGGEVYRNHNFNPGYASSLKRWIHYYVFSYPVYYSIQDPSTRASLTDQMVHLLRNKLNLTADRITFDEAKSYYAQIFIPAWHGLRNSVENKYGHYFSPFTFPEVMDQARYSHKYTKRGDILEARMILDLHPQVAQLGSSYGHAFHKIPQRVLYKNYLKSNLPVSIKMMMGNQAVNRIRKKGQDQAFVNTKIDIFAESLDSLKSMDYPIDWNLFLANPSRKLFALSIGALISHIRKLAVS